MYIYMYVCMYVCMYIYIHTHVIHILYLELLRMESKYHAQCTQQINEILEILLCSLEINYIQILYAIFSPSMCALHVNLGFASGVPEKI